MVPHYFQNDEVHPDEAGDTDEGKKQPAGCPEPGAFEEIAEEDGTDKSAESAENSNEPADYADVVREVFGDVLVYSGFADAHHNSGGENEPGEDPHIGLEVDVGLSTGEDFFFGHFLTDFNVRFLPGGEGWEDNRFCVAGGEGSVGLGFDSVCFVVNRDLVCAD